MSDIESFADINFNGEVVKATRLNTILYQHLGSSALYDHIFIKNELRKTGGYIWANEPPNNPYYKSMVAAAVEAQCEAHVNIQTVAPGDVSAFEEAVESAIENFDGVPEDWA